MVYAHGIRTCYMYMVHVHGTCTWCMYVGIYGTCIWYLYMVYEYVICMWYMYIVYVHDYVYACRFHFASGQLGLRRFFFGTIAPAAIFGFLNRIFGGIVIDVSTSVLAKIYFFHIQSLVLTRGADSPRKSVVDPPKIVKFRAFWLEL